jgi:hypothetical protein
MFNLRIANPIERAMISLPDTTKKVHDGKRYVLLSTIKKSLSHYNSSRKRWLSDYTIIALKGKGRRLSHPEDTNKNVSSSGGRVTLSFAI